MQRGLKSTLRCSLWESFRCETGYSGQSGFCGVGGILLYGIATWPSGSGSYAQGQKFGAVFGLLVFLVGGYYLFRRSVKNT